MNIPQRVAAVLLRSGHVVHIPSYAHMRSNAIPVSFCISKLLTYYPYHVLHPKLYFYDPDWGKRAKTLGKTIELFIRRELG